MSSLSVSTIIRSTSPFSNSDFGFSTLMMSLYLSYSSSLQIEEPSSVHWPNTSADTHRLAIWTA